MTASNETANYKLPLFVDNDQPTWLGDFNGAMNKIDNDMNTIGANASTALSAANNVVNRVGQVETTITGVQTTANNAYSLSTTNKNGISTLDGKVSRLENKFPIKADDIAASAVTAEKLDAAAIAAMWKSQRVYRFDSKDTTADNAGLSVPNGGALAGFYLADLELLIIVNGYLHTSSTTTDVLTLPSYVPVAPRDIQAGLGCLHWTTSNYFKSWGAVTYKSGTRNLEFGSRTANTATNILGTITFFVGTGTSDGTSAVAYTNANGTFAL